MEQTPKYVRDLFNRYLNEATGGTIFIRPLEVRGTVQRKSSWARSKATSSRGFIGPCIGYVARQSTQRPTANSQLRNRQPKLWDRLSPGRRKVAVDGIRRAFVRVYDFISLGKNRTEFLIGKPDHCILPREQPDHHKFYYAASAQADFLVATIISPASEVRRDIVTMGKDATKK